MPAAPIEQTLAQVDKHQKILPDVTAQALERIEDDWSRPRGGAGGRADKLLDVGDVRPLARHSA